MTAPESTDTVRMPKAWPWSFRVAGPFVGAGVGFAAGPVMRWLQATFDVAPTPLRIAAALPTGWAVTVCAVLGLVAGVWIAQVARRESLVVTVDDASVTLEKNRDTVRLPGERIGVARRDGKDLVLLDRADTELARRDGSDLSWTRLRDVFRRHGYEWDGSATRDDRFRSWVDGDPELAAEVHDLLRSRGRALSDDRAGTAAELADRLRERGVMVRDRDSAQEVRRVRTTAP